MTARRVVGIDLALTKTGIGVVREDGRVEGIQLEHRRPVPKAKRAKAGLPPAPTLLERHACLVQAREEVWAEAQLADLVVIYQGYTGQAGQGHARQDVLALWYTTVAQVLDADIPVAVLTDSTARKAVTGRGAYADKSAGKVATALAVRALYPAVEIASDDVADGLAAAHLGAVALGWAVPTRAGHRTVKWSEWPTFGVEPDAAPEVAPGPLELVAGG